MKKKTKIIFSCIVAFIIILGISFFLYTSWYYKADSTAENILSLQNVSTRNNMIILKAEEPTTSGFIFYPGAKVEESAYLPLLAELQQNSITCIVIKMPFHLAIFGQNAANSVYAHFPEITNWFIGGHSLGGAMASSYFAKNQAVLDGLVLLGAYVYDHNIDAKDVLLIYGSDDGVLSREKLTMFIPNTYIIEGGNHAYFGNYGEQKGDGTATISREEQQRITAELIMSFITAF